MVGYRLENNNGQKITNGVRKLTNRNLDYGLNFDGSNDYVNIPYNPLFAFNVTDDFTISFSFSVDAFKPFTCLFGNILSQGGYYGGINDNNIITIGFVTIFPYIERAEYVFVPPLVLGKSYNVVITFSNKIAKIYLDGKEYPIISAGVYPPTISYFNPLRLGVYDPIPTSFQHDGVMFDFKLFNKTLNQAESIELSTYNRTPITATSNLILHLPFNEITGTTVTDKSASGLNGTLVGYNSGEKPLRDIQNTTVQEFIIP